MRTLPYNSEQMICLAVTRYRQSGEIFHFWEHAYGWIQNYIASFDRDEDVQMDFVHHFLNRADQYLQRLEKSDAPTEAYFKRCVRNEFYNYRRACKQRSVELELHEPQAWHSYLAGERPASKSSGALQQLCVKATHQVLRNCSPINSALFKAYYGIEFSRDELRTIAERSSPLLCADLVKEIELRCRKIDRKDERIWQRLVYLERASFETHVQPTQLTRQKIKRYYQKQRQELLRLRPLFSCKELAEYSSLSRSRISRTIALIRQRIIYNIEVQQNEQRRYSELHSQSERQQCSHPLHYRSALERRVSAS